MVTPTQSQIELEIAAFQGPHIKRARIVLFCVGVLYIVLGAIDYPKISEARAQLAAWGDQRTAAFQRFEHSISILYGVVVFTIIAGIANVFLAAIAGKRTMAAFWAAGAIFVAYSCMQLYLFGLLLFTSVLWWLAAIVLGLGFGAAQKAEKLRATGGAG